MDHQVFRIHNHEDFVRITKGIKVARCMQLKSSSGKSRSIRKHNKRLFEVMLRHLIALTAACNIRRFKYLSDSALDTDKVLSQLDELVVSDSLSCSFCNAVFEDQAQQRLHYKLDWHRYNLKQRLGGLKSVSEENFGLLADKGNIFSQLKPRFPLICASLTLQTTFPASRVARLSQKMRTRRVRLRRGVRRLWLTTRRPVTVFRYRETRGVKSTPRVRRKVLNPTAPIQSSTRMH